MNILVIAPHHDDEVIGCGGSIALHAARGDIVIIAYVTQGWSGIPSAVDRGSAVRQIRNESAEAGRILGVDRAIECGVVDRDFSVNEALIGQFVRLCRETSPAIIYLPHEHDGDHEHQLVYTMMRQAVWQAASPYFTEYGPAVPLPDLILGYEVWRPLAAIQMSVNITAVMEHKLRALQCYGSQVSQCDWVSAVKGLAAYRGVTSGAGTYAEVFQVMRCRNVFSQ
ncbi:MAG: PIG-L deacetylase family protein [Patescibacteria group bacterium]